MKTQRRSFFKVLGSVIGLSIAAPVIARAEQTQQPLKIQEPEKRSWKRLWLRSNGSLASFELDIPGNKVTVKGFDRDRLGSLYGKKIV